MRFYFNIANAKYSIDTSKAINIAITQKFTDDQPNFFDANMATKEIYHTQDFMGCTDENYLNNKILDKVPDKNNINNSCNVNVIKLNIHCNGTHTESKQHIDYNAKSLAELNIDCFLYAKLISIEPIKYTSNIKENYNPGLNNNDIIISAEHLLNRLSGLDFKQLQALIIRTLPNTEFKINKKYNSDQDSFPFLTNEAMELIASSNIKHILIDTPSLERSYDSNTMINHKIFWQQCDNKTITEFIYVNDSIVDDYYILNLQLPDFQLDAAPSRPIIFKIEKNNE